MALLWPETEWKSLAQQGKIAEDLQDYVNDLQRKYDLSGGQSVTMRKELYQDVHYIAVPLDVYELLFSRYRGGEYIPYM